LGVRVPPSAQCNPFRPRLYKVNYGLLFSLAKKAERSRKISRKPVNQYANARQIYNYKPHIDGIRAIAVLAVVIFHAWPSSLPGGFTGVDIFFVISGYLITGHLMSKPNFDRKDLVNFWVRRIRRIFPALIFMLSVTFLVGWALYLPEDFMNLGFGVFAGGISAANLVFLAVSEGYFDSSEQIQPMLHLWSLGIEEQFYFLLPILILLIKPKNQNQIWIVLAIFAATSLMLSVYFSDLNPTFAFYSPLTRFWELLIGAGLFWFTTRKIREEPKSTKAIVGVLGVGLIFSGFFLIDDTSTFPGAMALIPTLGAAALIYAGDNFKPLSLPLKSRLLVFVGNISYSLYLWHWVFLTFPENLAGRPLSFVEKILAILAAITLATISTFLVEKPFRLKDKNDAWTLSKTIAMVTTMCTLAVFGLIVFVSNGSAALGITSRPLIGPSDTIEIRNFLTTVPQFDWGANAREDICHLQTISDWHPVCTHTGSKSILIWGDSHAASLYPGFDTVFRPKGFSLSQLTVAGCPPIQEVDSLYKPDCRELQELAVNKINELQPNFLIIHAAWEHYDYPYAPDDLVDLLRSQLDDHITNLPNTRILVLGPVPRWEGTPQSVTYESWLRLGSKNEVPSPLQSATQLRLWDNALETLANQKNVEFISMNEVLCRDEISCTSYVGFSPEDFTAIDNSGHLSKAGAIFAVERIASSFRD